MKFATRSTRTPRTHRASAAATRRVTSSKATTSFTGKRKFADLSKEEKKAARLRSKERARQWAIDTYGSIDEEDTEEEAPPAKARRQENMASPRPKMSKRQLLEVRQREHQLKYDTTLTQAQKKKLKAQVRADAAAVVAATAAASASTPTVTSKASSTSSKKKSTIAVPATNAATRGAASTRASVTAAAAAKTTIRHHRKTHQPVSPISPPQESQQREPVAPAVRNHVVSQRNHFTEQWEDMGNDFSYEARNNGRAFLRKTLIGLFSTILMIPLGFALGVALDAALLSPFTATEQYSVCFENSVTASDDFFWTSEACQAVPKEAWLPCPKDALCVGGVLEECGFHQQVIADGTACAIAETAKETIQTMVTILKEWSVAEICFPTVNKRVVGRSNEGNIRLFDFALLAGELNSTVDLLLVELANDSEPVFVSELRSDGKVQIGLHPTQQDFRLPHRCSMKLALKKVELGMVDCIFFLILRPAWFILSSVLILLWEEPLASACVFILLPAVLFRWMSASRRQRLTEELQRDCNKLKTLVCKVLRANREKPHSIMYLRDHFLWDESLAFSGSVEAEQRMRTKVWPLVISAIQMDNRVTKARASFNGELQNTWQWKAMAP